MATNAVPLPGHVVALLQHPRPDVHVWADLCRALDAETMSSQQLAEVKRALSSWPREVPRKAPLLWASAGKGDVVVSQAAAIYRKQLLGLCLDVAETESLYNYYIGQIAASPRLRLRDGSPAVTLWRQLRGRVQLQNGTSLALGEGQSGLADLGGVMTVEWDSLNIPRRETFEQGMERMRNIVAVRQPEGPPELRYPARLNLYVEVEVKTDGKLPPSCREYRGTSTRQLTTTEQEQVQRQQAQLTRGGFYAFAERVDEVVSLLARYRDDVVARLS